jgi:hypothetical protein
MQKKRTATRLRIVRPPYAYPTQAKAIAAQGIFMLCTLHLALCTLHSVLCTLHFVLCTLHFVLCTLHPAPCASPYSTLHFCRFALQ